MCSNNYVSRLALLKAIHVFDSRSMVALVFVPFLENRFLKGGGLARKNLYVAAADART
jgi:hypothetical protein